MDAWTLLVPIGLVVARISGFVTVLPIFGSGLVPAFIRVGLVLVLSMFTLATRWSATVLFQTEVHWMVAVLGTVQEVSLGVGLGLCIRLIFTAVHQGGCIFAQAIGLTDAGVIDPVSGEESSSLAEFLEIIFTLFFLVAGGHQLLLAILFRSYDWFPLGSYPGAGVLAGAVMEASVIMLTMAVQLAAPVLGGFLILAAVLAVLARVMPDMNILFESYPLRVGVGYLMAIGVVGALNGFVAQVTAWMRQFLTV
jgi:flagellar biosynthetic protein FliR